MARFGQDGGIDGACAPPSASTTRVPQPMHVTSHPLPKPRELPCTFALCAASYHHLPPQGAKVRSDELHPRLGQGSLILDELVALVAQP